MSVRYYDALLPVHDPGPGLGRALAGLGLPYRALASVGVPAGQIVVALVSDSAQLSGMFAANWAPAAPGREPAATLYALTRPASWYGLDGHWDRARWWSPAQQTMAVFGAGSYRLVKVCVRGMCSAVSTEDTVFLHGCALAAGAGTSRRGVVIIGSSGAGKTTLVARLLRHREFPVAVLNDDWGAISLTSGRLASTRERMLHMKSSSVRALCPGFFETAPAGAYQRDVSEPDRAARVLVWPESVYGAAWDPTATVVVEQVAVIVREPPGWLPPAQATETAWVLQSKGGAGLVHHHEAFFNGSLILVTEDDTLREKRRYGRLLDRITVSWINNCGTPDDMVTGFISAVTK